MNIPGLRNINFSDMLAAALCVLTAFTLQIQITVFSAPDYLGLRLNLTDFLVPLAGLAIFASVFRHETLVPHWQMRYLYRWIAAISALFVFGILNSYIQHNEISKWGLVNKLGGWFILLGIMGIGGWIGTNARQRHIERFIQIFIYVAVAILAIQIALFVLQSYPSMQEWVPYGKYVRFPIEGIMANRNAYALFIISVVAISTCFYLSDLRLIKPLCVKFIYFMLPFYFIFNGSRTAFAVLLMIIISITICKVKAYKKKCFYLLVSFLLGMGAFACVYHDKSDQLYFISASMYEFIWQTKQNLGKDGVILTDIGKNITNPGDSMRLVILEDAFQMVENHPIIGSGLGSVFFFQEQKYGKIINLIDCTPLWILVETGAIGLIIFMLFYFNLIKSVYAPLKTDEEFTLTLRTALLFSICGFTLMCLLHEIMYTRHMWFLIGLGLTLPSKMRQDV